ncbi:MAG TPA: prolyl oligopeptidase family serine peptidase [Bacteroidales bacterium]|nr:prolyl oligopeptidase family serine peptidase [Bacteroidales bacterium]
MKKLIIALSLIIFAVLTTQAQPGKKLLTVNDIVKWNRITDSKISDDGKYVAVKIEPWKGRFVAKLYNSKGEEIFSADSAKTIFFTPDSRYLVLNKAGKKAESLVFYSISKKEYTKRDSTVSFRMLPEWGNWVAVKGKDSVLTILDLSTGIERKFTGVADFLPAKKGKSVLIKTKNQLVYAQIESNKTIELSSAKKTDKMSISADGLNVAWISGGELRLKSDGAESKQITVKGNNSFPDGWRVSENGELRFSDDGTKIYFGTAPAERQRDTTVAKDEWPTVQVWNWKEKTQFTIQVIDKEKDKKKSFLAVYDIKNDIANQIESPLADLSLMLDKGNSDYAVNISNDKYKLEEMWEGRTKYDVYLVNTLLGRSTPVITGLNGEVRASPKGRFLYWYSLPDSSWFTFSVSKLKEYRVSSPAVIKASDEENDVPEWPSSYQIAGWNDEETALYIYDRYDIWRVSPDGGFAPERITRNGRENHITYRVLRLDEKKGYIDDKNTLLLSSFNEISRESGFCTLNPNRKEEPKQLLSGPFMYGNVQKAASGAEVMYTKESFELFPDLWLSDMSFRKPIRITNANPQQSDFNWGTAELIKWTTLDGKVVEGVIYKPADFDPNKKYPMIVNFYEKNSSTLYSYRTPEAHRSTIDYHMYTSNGYVVFNPDIYYKEGYPGESAYNCIMPGISAILNMGFVDKAKIGAQGHSWGGYQVAYLATRTSLFAAIESGAPVVNMFSAYGGIRWGTGHNRSFQYEHEQSRIGKTPWESPLRYIENSPIFSMDKVTTPILIMANDKDGHVPWYQGIEYFTSLKRLQKPVWLLNYSGEVHWPQKMENKIDFQKRMMQFFNHYLKGEQMPEWMSPGVSAIDLDYRLGY